MDDSYRALLILGSLTLDPVTFYHTSSPFQVPRVLGELKKNADTADALCKTDLNRIPRNRGNLLCHGRCFVNWPHRLQLHWSLAPLPPQARDILKHLQSPSWLLASLRTPQPTQSIFPAKTQASPSPGSPACRPLHSPQAALHCHCCWEMLLIELCLLLLVNL